MKKENAVERVDLLISPGTVITLNDSWDLIPDGAVAVADGKIRWVGPSRDAAELFEAEETLDAGGGVIMPGLINAHTHASMTLFRGLADDLELMTWLNDYIFPAEKKLNREMVFWGAMLAAAEMIASGTTCFCDMYIFEDRVAQAAADCGIRAVVGEVLYDFPSPNYGESSNGLSFTRELIAQWRDHPLVSVAVEPHAVYTCSPELLKKCMELAEETGTSMMMHLAESRGEVDDIVARYGTTPVRHLGALGLLSERFVGIHCVVLDREEMRLMAEAGVRVAHNQESNLKLATGISPVPEMLELGIEVGLGTDGAASNNDLDMFTEMDFMAKVHKGFTLDPTVMDARSCLRVATRGSAAVVGLGDRIGALEEGRAADIIVLDFDKPHLTPVYNHYSHLVYAASGADVCHTVVNGRILYENGRFTSLDIEEVKARVRELARGFGR
jgi:5-methylthioadenosine/S-adenosylhomocysteine deaminase